MTLSDSDLFVLGVDRANVGSHASKDEGLCKQPIPSHASATASRCR